MKKAILFCLFLILTSTIFAWRDNDMEVRVYYNNDYELGKLVSLQPKGDIYPNGEALIYLIPSELENLKITGLKYKIEREDVKTFAENFWQSQDNTREAYHTYEEIVTLADSLADAFPDICEKHLFGTSVQGRELGVLKITDNVTQDENEAEIMFDGGIHGDEIGAAENCIRFARDLCREYNDDPDITYLVNNREIWIYYMVNPDGRVADDRTNANGVDLNRDSGYMWDAWGGSPGAYSQPESKALRDCHYNRQFVVHTTYHSGTEYISHPWSYRADLCPDYSHINQLAGVYSSSSGYANMDYGQGCTGMYAINGSTKDTNYGMMGAISWSMEISYNKHPAASQLMMYYNYNKPAMLSMIEHSGYGLEGVVTDVNTGDPIAGAVFINDYFPTYTDPNFGDYHKYVLPGTYEITVKANGYEELNITDVTVTANSSTVQNFELQPLEGQYVYKVSSSQIPDNNDMDEGDTPGVIGEPDSRNYSIGKSGWIVVDMEYPIPDGEGNDLIVYEGDTSTEGYSVFAGETIDGPWISLGEGVGTTEFDLAEGNMIEVRFFKIEDDGDGIAISADAGFDLDAVEAIAEVGGVYIALVDYELDEMIGNTNGYIDPGETMDMSVTIRNNGSLLAEDVEGLLTTTSGFVTMNNGDVSFGSLAPGQEMSGIFTFTVDVSIPIGELLPFDLEISANAGSYTTNFNIDCMVGIAIEDFETGNFLSFDWEFGGTYGWMISTDYYEGLFSALSGEVDDDETSSLLLTVEVAIDGELSFYKKVSSESGWDFLKFYIDGDERGSWSGESDWSMEAYQIPAGNHSFKWEYVKDGSVSNGNDCSWIDYIIFPPLSIDVPLIPPVNLQAEVVNYNEIELTWEAPVTDISDLKRNSENSNLNNTRDLIGYNVYLDDNYLDFTTELQFTIFALNAGDYEIYITTVYDEGESVSSNSANVTITLPIPIDVIAQSQEPNIIISWSLPASRGLSSFNIYRNSELLADDVIASPYEDLNVPSGNYTYNVIAVYDDNWESEMSDDAFVNHTDINETLAPTITQLVGNYPNPFNPTTTISFSLKEAGIVAIDIFNMKGQLVKTLINEEMTGAYHNVVWNGKDNKNKQVTSGIYFYKMKTGKYQETKKMILMK